MKLSIITINLNNLQGLQKTMESVFAQTFMDYEYIIIDGGSTDGSKELIEKQANKLVYWVSEKDEGVYQAMNKGIEKAKGDYIHFLNSGDVYYSGKTLQAVFQQAKNVDLLCGQVENVSTDKKWMIIPPEKLTYLHLREHNLPHQGTFIKAAFFQKAGLYNEGLHIAADWEFVLKAMAFHNASYQYINEIISIYPFNGISSLPENRKTLMDEKNQIIHSLFHFFEPDYVELVECKRELNKYTRSRLHSFLNRVINSRFYRLFKN